MAAIGAGVAVVVAVVGVSSGPALWNVWRLHQANGRLSHAQAQLASLGAADAGAQLSARQQAVLDDETSRVRRWETIDLLLEQTAPAGAHVTSFTAAKVDPTQHATVQLTGGYASLLGWERKIEAARPGIVVRDGGLTYSGTGAHRVLQTPLTITVPGALITAPSRTEVTK
jgi:hypothetical protein